MIFSVIFTILLWAHPESFKIVFMYVLVLLLLFDFFYNIYFFAEHFYSFVLRELVIMSN